MIINEGIGTKPIQVYKNLINLKFLFSIICVLIFLFILPKKNIFKFKQFK